MNEENRKIYERATFQSKIWKYFAWSLPMIWLVAEFLLYMFGFENIANKLLIFGGIFFFAISIIWWWWAVDTIRLFAEAMQRTSNNFNGIKQELRKVRENLNK